MELWILWWNFIKLFRPCFSRTVSFHWFVVSVMAITVRFDLAGVSSFVRCLGFRQIYYDRWLDFFHSKAGNLESLAKTWVSIVIGTGLAHKVNGRFIIIGDGIKAPKEGRKMPAVKSLHQESQSNSKAEYIMGHSFQALSLLTTSVGYFFATPLISRIHEGIVESNRCQKTLLDKMVTMLDELAVSQPYYLVCDAYYAVGKVILPLLKRGQHLISRVRINAVAYLPIVTTTKRRRGRPKVYGKKIFLRDMLKDTGNMIAATANLYGEAQSTFHYSTLDLFWRPVGTLVRFVFVVHPTRGCAIFMSSDLSLLPLQIITIYSLRFKIEVSFKQAMRTLGVFSYHFWMHSMDRIKRCSGDQHLHHKSENYRSRVKRKIRAYHMHVQVGLIAQGVLQIISMTSPQLVWKHFGSWIRTIRPNILPSEAIVMSALRNTVPQYIKGDSSGSNIEKFIRDRIDLERAEGQRMAA